MIDNGRERGTLETFFDADAKVIDFAAAGEVLTDSLLPHGGIDSGLLLDWYRGRGREQRFDHEDVLALVATAAVEDRGLSLVSATEFGQAPKTRMYTAAAVRPRQDA